MIRTYPEGAGTPVKASIPRVSRVRVVLAGLLLAGWCASQGAPLARAQQGDGSFTNPMKYAPRDGAVLYRTSCQACHMAQGEGASGAGVYPALAKNTKLRTARYPVYVVTNGQKGMPPFGPMMDDEQIAAVVNYIRTNLGNGYGDTVSAADVKAIRK